MLSSIFPNCFFSFALNAIFGVFSLLSTSLGLFSFFPVLNAFGFALPLSVFCCFLLLFSSFLSAFALSSFCGLSNSIISLLLRLFSIKNGFPQYNPGELITDDGSYVKRPEIAEKSEGEGL